MIRDDLIALSCILICWIDYNICALRLYRTPWHINLKLIFQLLDVTFLILQGIWKDTHLASQHVVTSLFLFLPPQCTTQTKLSTEIQHMSIMNELANINEVLHICCLYFRSCLAHFRADADKYILHFRADAKNT